MRVNVYEEELTTEIVVVPTTAETGEVFYGVRIFLESSNKLHNRPDDDDRSAVTIWVGSEERAAHLATSIHRSITGDFL